MRTILCVDDVEEELQALQFQLADRFRVLTCTDGARAAPAVVRHKPAAVLLDLGLPGYDGFRVLADIQALPNPPPVLMLSGHHSPLYVVRAIRSGASDFIAKPFNPSMVRFRLERAFGLAPLYTQAVGKGLSSIETVILGHSTAIREIRREIAAVSAEDLPVLILGETGTGKDLVAQMLHRLSIFRSAGRFVVRNIGALPETIVEAELFGSEVGAFTDARRRIGCFEEANGGSLFLDELGNTSLKSQAALLRIVEDGVVRRLGANQEIQVDVRLITAMNKSPEQLIRRRLLREDLFYRISAYTITMPPLREHPEDIPELAEHFLHRREKVRTTISDEAFQTLMTFDWPGNVRQLKACLERARIASGGGRIYSHHLRLHSSCREGLNTFGGTPRLG